MSDRTDLTRWNRAGLARFRYVDGNAPTYLDELRRALADRFPDWRDVQLTPPPGESTSERLERLLAAYHGERGDWGWEVARVLARACHVLTEHVDAYANEGYLGTATQWDNVRRLVELLDYHPAPPASARTSLVVLSKGAPEPLESGFQVQHTPPDGGSPVVFETLDDAELDAVLNRLRPTGWNRSPETFREAATVLDRPVGELGSRVIQGVGDVYSALLDAHKRAETGDPAATFTLSDLRSLDPASVSLGISRIRLQEFRSKAQEILGLPSLPDPLEPLLDRSPLRILSTPTATLARETGRPESELDELRRALRRVQISLDESAFGSLRLRDLVGDGTSVPPSPWIVPEDAEISAGQLGVMIRDPGTAEAAVVRVVEVDPGSAAITFEDPPFQLDWRGWTKGETTLRVTPDFIERPRLNGPGVVAFEDVHDLVGGEVVAWRDLEGDWVFDTVAEADDVSIRLVEGGQPPLAARVFRAFTIERGAEGLTFPFESRAEARSTASGFVALSDTDWEDVEITEGDAVAGAHYRRLTRSDVSSISLVPSDSESVGQVAAPPPGEIVFGGKPGKLASGQWVVADDGARLWPLLIARITEAEDSYGVSFGPASRPLPPVGEEPVTSIQGIGGVYSAALAAEGVTTVGDLARPEVLELGVSISTVRLWEFVTKARVVLGFPGDPDVLAPVLERTLKYMVDTPDEVLAEALSRPPATARELKEELRWIEASLDQPTFDALELRALLPAPGGAVRGETEDRPTSVVRLYGGFEHELRPEGHDRNPTPLAGSRVDLELDPLPRLLARGRRLVVDQEDGSDPFEARVLAVLETEGAIEIDPPIPGGLGFTVGNTVIAGNVVPAGHGESRPAKTLGSGDATLSGQSFVLDEDEVSFVADSTQPRGVRAAVDVVVEGRTWQQVATLRDSEPTDAHYAVRMTEEGHLRIEFGDGRRGRRLPTGANNVRVRFRVGTGLAGNLAAGSIDKPIRPHARVASIRQPLPATGGNDQEPVSSMRENAPASLLTLDRAVSLSDFGLLAARQASVWQARAFALPTGANRHESVEVVVVPAGGGALGDLGARLRGVLNAHALPGVEILVSAAEIVALDLDVTVRVRSAEYEPEDVLETLRSALLDAFSLRRRLGQDLFLGEVYEVVEEVPGVENSLCVLAGDPALRRVEASERQVLHLDPVASVLALRHEEFQP